MPIQDTLSCRSLNPHAALHSLNAVPLVSSKAALAESDKLQTCSPAGVPAGIRRFTTRPPAKAVSPTGETLAAAGEREGKVDAAEGITGRKGEADEDRARQRCLGLRALLRQHQCLLPHLPAEVVQQARRGIWCSWETLVMLTQCRCNFAISGPGCKSGAYS